MDPIKLTIEEFDCLNNFIEQNCGILLNRNKSYLLESRLFQLLQAYDCHNYQELCRKVQSNPHSKLQTEIIDAITTNETLWFRDHVPFDILDKVLFKKWFAEIKEKKRAEQQSKARAEKKKRELEKKKKAEIKRKAEEQKRKKAAEARKKEEQRKAALLKEKQLKEKKLKEQKRLEAEKKRKRQEFFENRNKKRGNQNPGFRRKKR